MAGDPTGRISHIPEMHRGQSWKIAVRCATTGAGTLASSFENGDTVDGVTLATGDRILIKNQASGSENGIYTVNASGAPTRAHDMDQDGTTAVPAAEVFGAVIWVVSGTTNAATLWYCTNTGTITLGSTSLTFSQFSSGGASFGTPALTYSTTNSAGAASTAIRTDATVAVFDATVPTTQAFGDSAATGSAAFAARRDHKHGEPTAAVTTSGLTQATGKMLGRSTAATGAIEEITVGSGLTLSGGTITAGGGGGGGGTIGHSYLGYNTVGASTENMTQYRVYMKKITVAADGLITSISAYIQERDNGDHVGDLAVALYTDSSGSPDILMGSSQSQSITAALIKSSGSQGSARWFHRPLGIWVTAADYWIAAMEPTGTTGHRIYKDGSGSDRYYSSASAWFTDSGFYAVTTSTDKYSIRCSIIT